MIDFPSAGLVVGQLFYASNGVTYRWNGTVWLSEPSLGTGYGPTGDFCATLGSVSGGGTATTLIPTSIVSGNAGSWYSTSTGLYRPPPGRYFLYGSLTVAYSPGAMTVQLGLRKNGGVIASNTDTTGAATYSSNPNVGLVIDANGTDVFDLFGGGIGAVCTHSQTIFLAYPIAGAKGPPGDPGAPGVPASSNVWRLIQRVVPAAGQVAIDFTNIPADINDLELRYDVSPTTNNQFLYLQVYDGAGTLITTANYGYFADYTYDALAAGGTVTAYNGTSASAIVLNLNSANWGVQVNYWIQGNVKVNNIRDTTKGHSFQCDAIQVDAGNTYYALLKGGGVRYTPGALTGLRLVWNTGTFQGRGAASLYGSP